MKGGDDYMSECFAEFMSLRSEQVEIENRICDLYKKANSLLQDERLTNHDEIYILVNIMKACARMLKAAND